MSFVVFLSLGAGGGGGDAPCLRAAVASAADHPAQWISALEHAAWHFLSLLLVCWGAAGVEGSYFASRAVPLSGTVRHAIEPHHLRPIAEDAVPVRYVRGVRSQLSRPLLATRAMGGRAGHTAGE